MDSCATRWCSRSTGRAAARRGRPGSRRPACRSVRRARSSSRSPTSAARRWRTRTCAPRTCEGRAVLPAHASTSARECLLVQLPESATPEEIFSDYAYFSSSSESWLRHADGLRRDDHRAARARRARARSSSSRATTATCCSTSSSAAMPGPRRRAGRERRRRGARARASRRSVAFFGSETAQELVGRGLAADLVLGNNVLAHVPDLNDFVAGVRILLKPRRHRRRSSSRTCCS